MGKNMKQKIKKNSFFDAAFFKFTFSALLKKVSIYLAISAYFLLILIFTTITPLLSNSNPITIISNPIMALFLVFSMAIIGCFVSIEIFRTSIDDGTELLVISKPLSRTEIISVKCIIFVICIVIISLIGALLSTASFFSTNSYYVDNINIILGVFVGSLVCGLLFGSLATILSIYLRKVVSMLLTIAIAFLLMVYSLLSTFVVDNPVKIMENQPDTIVPLSVINYDNKDSNENNNKNKLSVVQGVVPIIGGLDTTKTAESIWNYSKSRSNYAIAGTFDFGAQLGSIFSLTTPPKDSLQALANLSSFNTPIDITFSDYNLLDDNIQQGLFLRFPIADINVDNITTIPNQNDKDILKNVLANYNNSSRKVSKFIGIKNESSSLRVPNSRVWGSSIDYSYGDFINANTNSELWENAWNKTVSKIENNQTITKTIGEIVNERVKKEKQWYNEAREWKSNPNNSNIYPSWLPTYLTKNEEKDAYLTSLSKRESITSPARIFLEEYANSFNLKSYNVNNFIREINSIILSAFYKYTKLSVFDPTVSNSRNEMDILNIIDLMSDIDNDVIVDNLYPGFDSIDPNANRELYLVKQALKQIYNENTGKELTGKTKFSEIQAMISNNNELNQFFVEKSKTRNEYRAILELLGIYFPEMLNKNEVNLINYFTSSADDSNKPILRVNIDAFQNLVKATDRIRFQYYVGNNPNGVNDVKTLEEFDEWNKDNWIFSFYSSTSLTPAYYVQDFSQIHAYNLINRDILIPVWIFVSLIMFSIGMMLYSKRDFA